MRARVVDRDKGWNATLAAARAASAGASCKVGILGGAERGGLHHKRPDGTSEPLTIAEIAVVQEFGTVDGRIPARSFVRAGFDVARAKLAKMSEALIRKVVLDRAMSVEDALNLLGMKLATEIKNYVALGPHIPPPLSASTVAAKGSTRPLVDTGAMVNSIAWAVVMNGAQKAARYLGGK